MKKLFSLIVAAGLTLCSSNLCAQEFKLPHETDRNKFIPSGAWVTDISVDTRYYGIKDAIWYNKECNSQSDYGKKLMERGGDIPRDELFLDLDNPCDGIPDLSLEDFDKLIEDYQQSTELAKTYL
jgi:hypothetical protein